MLQGVVTDHALLYIIDSLTSRKHFIDVRFTRPCSRDEYMIAIRSENNNTHHFMDQHAKATISYDL